MDKNQLITKWTSLALGITQWIVSGNSRMYFSHARQILYITFRQYIKPLHMIGNSSKMERKVRISQSEIQSRYQRSGIKLLKIGHSLSSALYVPEGQCKT